MARAGGVVTALLASRSVATSASAQYRFDSFTTSNGLPQKTAAAVLQTRDGCLWIATYDGLVGSDRVRFADVEKAIRPPV